MIAGRALAWIVVPALCGCAGSTDAPAPAPPAQAASDPDASRPDAASAAVPPDPPATSRPAVADASPPPADPRLSPRPSGRARAFYVDRFRPDDEAAFRRPGRTTVILEKVRDGPEFTREDRDALRAKLARFPNVTVVLVEEVTPPSGLTERDEEQEPFREEQLARLPRAIASAPIEEWEAHLGERLHVGDVIDVDPSRYRGVWCLIVGEEARPGEPRRARVLSPFRGGEFFVTPPAYLSCPDRVPFDYWSDDLVSYKVDCFPVEHAWLRAHVTDGRVQLGARSYRVGPDVVAALADPASALQVYAHMDDLVLLTYDRHRTLGQD